MQYGARFGGHSPPRLVADEKHSWRWDKRIYITVTAAVGWFLGASLAPSADADALKQAHGEFQQESQQVNPNGSPQRVNTNRWDGTQQAWKALFPNHDNWLLNFLIASSLNARGTGQKLRQN